jgi:hypothetical protein
MVVPSQRSHPMGEHGPTIGRQASDGWGLVVFAAVLMITLGIFQALVGVSAIRKDQLVVSVPTADPVSLSVTTWGWIHLVGGALIALAGFYVVRGALWARAIGITLAILSAIANFTFIPHYPFWSLLMIALDVLIIWALAVNRYQVAT